ncbi:MAG: DUF883 C-terminal domain-containing protein [Methylobacter sp.]|nr:DUF883 C-terminal domain-containing protein [Methylobacter sp.]
MEATEKTNNIDETVNRLRSGAHEAVDKAADVTTQAAEVMSQKGEQLMNMEQQFLENCRTYIHEKPVTSLGIAVGAGFLLSRILSGR